MLVHNGMLMGTGTAYKHHTATQKKREGAPTEQHTCPTRAQKGAGLVTKTPASVHVSHGHKFLPAWERKKKKRNERKKSSEVVSGGRGGLAGI